MSLLTRRRALLSAKGKVLLPKEYQQVEYLESTGTQYINTNVYPDTNTKVEIDMQIVSYRTITAGYNFYIGTRNSNSVLGRFELLFMASTGRLYFNIGSTTDYRTIYDIQQDFKRHLYTLDGISKKMIMDNSVLLSDMGEESCSDWKTSNLPLRLFRETFNSTSLGGNMKMYNLKIYQANKLTNEYIPCYRKTDNKAGLYDLVNGKFYTNDGTGEFILGGEV